MSKYGIILFGALLLGSCATNNQSPISDKSETTTTLNDSEDYLDEVHEESSSDLENDIETYKPFSRVYKIYINPSVQMENLYVGGYGSEGAIMQKLGKLLVQELANIPNLEVYSNTGASPLSLTQSVIQSNNFAPDLHLALHTNAGGGRGSEVFYRGNRAFAEIVLDDFLSLGDFKNRGIKSGEHLYEVRNCQANAVALMEFLFHDNYQEATFIVENLQDIAKTLKGSIIKYINLVD